MKEVKRPARLPHLSNKSLILLGEFTKLAKYDAVKNFVNNLAPKWPEGRQILYDLLKNSDKWMRIIFTYTPIYHKQGTMYFEIRLSAHLYPDKADNFYALVRGWKKGLPAACIPESNLFRKHLSTTQKIFETKEGSLDYAKKNYELLMYSKYFYSKK